MIPLWDTTVVLFRDQNQLPPSPIEARPPRSERASYRREPTDPVPIHDREGWDSRAERCRTSESSSSPRGEQNGRSGSTLRKTKAAETSPLLRVQPLVRGGERARPIVPICFVIHFLTLPNTSEPPSVLSSRLVEANALAQPLGDRPR
eukprot:scaffold2178_cov363-Pavlova_lutheri.AAC.3